MGKPKFVEKWCCCKSSLEHINGFPVVETGHSKRMSNFPSNGLCDALINFSGGIVYV